MKKMLMFTLCVITLFMFVLPPTNAHAILWLFGCNSCRCDLPALSQGHWEYGEVEHASGCFNAARHERWGRKANGSCYWIEETREWVVDACDAP